MTIEFEDGFESGDITKWDNFVVTDGELSVATINPRFGAWHARCKSFATATLQKRALVVKMFPPAQLKHARGYFYFTPGPLPDTLRLTFLALYPEVGAPGNYYATVTLRGNRLWTFYRDAATWKGFDTGIVLTAGKYYMFEFAVKVGAGTGEVHVWLDGTEVATILGITNNEWGGINMLRAGIVFGDATLPAQTVDLDEVAIGDSYIGPFLAGKPCFIATAAFGSPVASQLDSLRWFRDKYLPDTLVNLYYRSSPPFARYISKHGISKLFTRKTLEGLVKVIKGLRGISMVEERGDEPDQKEQTEEEEKGEY